MISRKDKSFKVAVPLFRTAMGLIPRRHRSTIYKLLVAIPLLWLTVALVLYNDRGSQQQHNEVGGGKRPPFYGA